MKRDLILGAIALGIAGLAGCTGAESSSMVSGLPRALGQPDCAPGEQYSRHEIDYMAGTGYATPRDALDKALATGHGHLASGDFSSRAVRVGDQAVREFTLERPDGSFLALAVATPGSDGGWIVSTVYECSP